jgi:hypothetical protein
MIKKEERDRTRCEAEDDGVVLLEIIRDGLIDGEIVIILLLLAKKWLTNSSHVRN